MRKFRFHADFGYFEAIQKQSYDGKGYRYSLKGFNNQKEEVYYHDSIATSKEPLTQDEVYAIVLSHVYGVKEGD